MVVIAPLLLWIVVIIVVIVIIVVVVIVAHHAHFSIFRVSLLEQRRFSVLLLILNVRYAMSLFGRATW
jgi:hypothetical protein